MLPQAGILPPGRVPPYHHPLPVFGWCTSGVVWPQAGALWLLWLPFGLHPKPFYQLLKPVFSIFTRVRGTPTAVFVKLPAHQIGPFRGPCILLHLTFSKDLLLRLAQSPTPKQTHTGCPVFFSIELLSFSALRLSAAGPTKTQVVPLWGVPTHPLSTGLL